MIGGTMLLCAVGAMILLAYWSMLRDDAPDSQERDGLLVLTRRPVIKKKAKGPRKRRSASSQTSTPSAFGFEHDEMQAIAKEAEETLPDFIRKSREEY